MAFDGKAFGAEIVGVVKDFVSKELAPLIARMDAVEKRLNDLPAPVDLSADIVALKAAVEAIEIPELPELPEVPELPDIAAMVDEAVSTAVAAIPTPQDGKSVTVDDVAPLIASEVEKRVRELPRAKDGQDGRDGVGMASALIDRDGNLIITTTSGETKDLGPVVGRDGVDAKGEPGIDGLGFDDLDVSYDGEKTIALKFTKGERVKEFSFAMPVVIDRGVFKEGQAYKAGDGVTWGGSFWIAQKDTESKPDSGDGWRLAVKKGRDGRDGTMKEAKPAGPVRLGPGRAEA